MDEAWRAKCGLSWPAPATAPLSPLLPGTAAPSSSSGNQMTRNFHQPLRSIGQVTNLGNNGTGQETSFFNTLNFDSHQAGKAELDNSYLDLLSGRSQYVSSNFLQVSSSASTSVNHVHNVGIATGGSCGAPIASIPSLLDNHGNVVLGSGQLFPFTASRPLPVSTCTNTSLLHDNFQIAASNATVCHEAFQGNNTGIEVSSWKHRCPTNSSSSNASQQHRLNQTVHSMRLGAKPSVSSHLPSNYFVRPRVFCMNKAGELFVSDMGVLGVICFCHEVPMSVAKFCEHSGSPSSNPGDAIRLENGMTVAQWRKLCFGVMSSGYGNGWEWSEDAFVGCKISTSSKNPASVNSLEASAASGRYGEPRNVFASSNFTDRRSRQNILQIVANRTANNTSQRNDLKGRNLFPNSLVGSPTSTVPEVAKRHTVQEVKGNPFWMSFEGSNLTSNKGKQNVGPQLVGINNSFPTISPCLGTRSSFPCEGPISRGNFSGGTNKSFSYSRGNFSTEPYLLDQDGVSSDIELRLGHLSGQSSNSHTSVKSFSAAIHPLQFRTEFNPPNPPLLHPLTHRNDYPKESEKSRLSLQSDSQSSDRRHMQHLVGSHNCRIHESEDPMADATKSSLISFLSHLNTGGNGTSQSADNMDVYNEYCTTDTLYPKQNLSNFTRDMSGGIEMKSSRNGFDLSNTKNQGKKLKVADSDSCGTVKPSYLVHHKQTAETNGSVSAFPGHYVHCTPMNTRNSTVCFNQSSDILQPTHCHNSSHCSGVSFEGRRGPCCHATCSSGSPVPIAAGIPDSGNFETPVKLTSANSIYASQQHPALVYNMNTDETQKSKDESLRSLSLRHMVELSKMEQSIPSHETSFQHRRLCCLSDIERRNIHKEDLVATERLKEGPFCITVKDAPMAAVKPGYPPSHHSGCNAQVSPIRPTSTNPYDCCNCTASPQKTSMCSTEHGIQFCGFHVARADKQHFLRHGGVSTIGILGNIENEMCNQKEESSSFSGKCCCSFVPKYLTGCHFSGHANLSGSLKDHVCQKTMLLNPAFDVDHILQDGKTNKIGERECLRNHVVMKNNCQTAPLEDITEKVIGHSGSTSNEIPTQMLPCTSIVGNQLTKIVAKEFAATCLQSKSVKGKQMSNVSSGSSGPAVTEVSVEINNVVSFATDLKGTKNVSNFMFDEGSGIEKCASSDEALGCSGFEEAITFRDNPVNSSRNLIDELRLESSSNLKRKRNQITSGCPSKKKTSPIKQLKQALQSGKQNGKMNRLVLSVSESPKHVARSFYHSASQEIDPSSQHDKDTQKSCAFSIRSSGVKQRRSALPSTKPFSFERSEKNQNLYECNSMHSIDDDPSVSMEKDSDGRNAKEDAINVKQKEKHLVDGKPPKYLSLSHIGNSVNHGVDTFKKLKPVVCGDSGIISSEASGPQKPAKLVSMSLILKKSSSCRIPEYTRKSKGHLISHNKKTCPNAKSGSFNLLPTWNVQNNNEDSRVVIGKGVDSVNLVSGKNKKSCKRSVKCLTEISITKNEAECGSNNYLKTELHTEDSRSQSKPKCKARKEHISQSNGSMEYGENEVEARNLLSTDCTGAFIGGALNCSSIEVSNRASPACVGLVHNYQSALDHENIPCEADIRSFTKGRKCLPFLSDSDLFCCVCGSSNKEDINNLLECSRCLIKVHQACYGVLKVPKGHWCCRPCKTNSSNTVCVLCGYGGGAMTRAIKSRNIVKSLLKAWNVGTGSILINSTPSPKSVSNELVKESSVGEASECNGSIPVVGSTINTEAVLDVASKTDLEDLQINNSITAGIFDPSATQWVHMVCGLWTPGTRCPNVDTMSTFDVSGALPARKNSVCSMCSRPGGSCIQCRVLNCSVWFHPWCAHQKGLLQSEIEGDDNENVGFYGRCMFHATHNSSYFQSNPVDAGIENPRKDRVCARTEGFKGRKREETLNPYCQRPSSSGTGCIVSQEQINAWLHINGQRSCTKGVVKPASADMEYDIRKEYVRYKQSKAWKNLVVYKSGIHALGLYTSQFITRGAMVVEYVGEIVGLRVADKREVDYQSGRRLQYKSACYFFRIDKEHIIDATRKGGIARFVNHSCLPNCVAKVISIRHEKKVVFFAERDLYPGEEVTYDYHFNHEDEGEKIPCFCNSKNCRRYLN